MLKKIPKIITTIFIVAFLFQLIGFIFILTTPEISQAIDVPKLQVPIGEDFSAVKTDGNTMSVPWIGEYISAVYKYAVGIVGILATVVMMFGGVLWITAGGNQERIGNAKSWITASLTGLVLTLCSYLILNTVNPDLTRFKPIEISVTEKIKISTIGCCLYQEDASNKCTNTDQDSCTDVYKGGTIDKNKQCNGNQCVTTNCCACKNVNPDRPNESFYNCNSNYIAQNEKSCEEYCEGLSQEIINFKINGECLINGASKNSENECL